ncbi:MAG: hypothetical protein ACRENK_16520 [Gemmatimonadaceae bacterium]
MTAYYPNTLNPFARDPYATGAPWLSAASQCTDSVIGDNYKGTMVLSGTALTSYNEEKGGLGAGLTSLSYVQDYAGRGMGAVQFNTPGSAGNGNATFDPIAAKIAGTAKAFSIFLSVQLRAVPGGGGFTYLLSFGSSAGLNPFVGFSILTGTTDLVFDRRNDAGTLVRTPVATTLGTTPHVIAITYDGVNLNSWIDNAQIDTNFAWGGGACTVNRFTLGCLRLNGAASGFSNMTFDRFAIAPGVAMNTTLVDSYRRYLMRRAGI